MTAPRHGQRPSITHPSTVPLVKVTQKKRSKSLGGQTLDQEVRRGKAGLKDSLAAELTPRKKARRSLVPGKSILKSRPTVTGLERASDCALLSHPPSAEIKLSVASAHGAPVQSPQNDPANLPFTPLISLESPEPATAEMPLANQPAEPTMHDADATSDMEISDGHAFPRSSMGSMINGPLRRVSFAAKAHVRTFGSPAVDPDSSIASSSPSANGNVPQPSASPPGSENSSLEKGNESSDMSIDHSLMQDQAAISQPLNQARSQRDLPPAPVPVEPPKPNKASRLSMAMPGFGTYDDDDPDDDDDIVPPDRNISASEINLAAKTQDATPTSFDLSKGNLSDKQPALGGVPAPGNTESSAASAPTVPAPVGSGPTLVRPIPCNIPRPSAGFRKLSTHRQSVSAAQSRKPEGSRVSLALTERFKFNETDDTDNLDLASLSVNPAEAQQSTPPQHENDLQKTVTQAISRTFSNSPERILPKKTSRLTDFLGADPNETDSGSSSHSQSRAPESTQHKKSSRLTEFLGADGDRMETESLLHSQSDFPERAQPNKASRLTEFLDAGRDQMESGSLSNNQSGTLERTQPTETVRPKQVLGADAEPAEPEAFLHPPSGAIDSTRRKPESRLSQFLGLPEETASIHSTDNRSKASRVHSPRRSAPFNLSPSEANSLLCYSSDRFDTHTGAHQSRATPDLTEFRRASLARFTLSSASPSRRLSASPSKKIVTLPRPRRSECEYGPPSIEPSSSSKKLSDVTAGSHVQTRARTSQPGVETSASSVVLPPATQTPDPVPLDVSIGERSSMPSSATRSKSSPEPVVTLSEFFEQAEIRFISLSQPRVRNHDQQEQPVAIGGQQPVSSFAQQVHAAAVKIPRLRMLESSARTLRHRTETLETTAKEQEAELQENPSRSAALREWSRLHKQKGADAAGQPNPPNAQKHIDELNELMNKLRLRKTWVELSSKRDCAKFELEMKQSYHADLVARQGKLKKDLEMMVKMCTLVQPSIDALRDRKRSLTEEIRRRKQKNAEIENCDQKQLAAIKEEAKDLAAVTEANRSALAESNFERNMWSSKMAELEEEKTEHTQKIEQLKLGSDPSQRCTVQELVRLRNEFTMLQTLMGWQLIRFEEDVLHFVFLSDIVVIFHLDPFDASHSYRNVGRIELRWTRSKSPHSLNNSFDDQLEQVEEFFFYHLETSYHAKKLAGRLKDFVQQILSIWNHARQLVREIVSLRSRFRIKISFAGEGGPRSHTKSQRMVIVAMLHSKLHPVSLDVQFELTGEEILDWKSATTIPHVSGQVTCHFGKADCQNLTYVVQERLDRGSSGAFRHACEEVLDTLDSLVTR